MTAADDTLDKLATETAASPAAEAMNALDRDSATAELTAAPSLSISKDSEEMRRHLKSAEGVPNLAATMAEQESPTIKAVREFGRSQNDNMEVARAFAATESSVVKAAREFAWSQSHITETARALAAIESPVVAAARELALSQSSIADAAKMSKLTASAANDFVSKVAAIESFSIVKQFSAMQASVGTSVTSKLLEASRTIADQWSSTFKQSQQLMQDQIAAINKSTQIEFSKIASLQSFANRSAFKDLAAVTSLSKDLFQPLAGLQGAFKDSLSHRFQEMSTSFDHSFTASAAQAALAFSRTLPQFDDRIVEALREFSAIGDLKAGDSTIAGVGTVLELPDIVSAKGERHGADAAHAEPIKRSPVELWWEHLPIELKFFFLVLLFILKSMSEEIIHEHVKGWTGAHSREERQVVYGQITQNFGEDSAKHLRCVRASTLKVREEPSAAGEILNLLPRGTPVEVLESHGSWSRIRYRVPHSTDIREGWAASGYLSFEIC
jgi:hypothetical protein